MKNYTREDTKEISILCKIKGLKQESSFPQETYKSLPYQKNLKIRKSQFLNGSVYRIVLRVLSTK